MLQLAEKRVKFYVLDKWPDRVINPIHEGPANSDDESGDDEDGKRVHIIAKKGIRSKSATSFIIAQEERRLKAAKLSKGKRRTNIHERTRIRVEEPEESDISYHMPKKVPIDWFVLSTSTLVILKSAS